MPATSTDRLNGITTSVAVKPPCRTVSTANLTLAALQTVNGVTLVEGDRVLVKDQTDATENGIYNASTSDWVRAADFDGNRDVVRGTLVIVDAGASSGVLYRVVTANPITIGTSEITFGTIDVELPAAHLDNYDAVGDGVTDDTTAINTAIAANSGRSIILRDGATYKVSDQLTFPVNTDLLIENDGSATIDAGTAVLGGSDAGNLVFEGSIGATLGGGLASTVSAGAISLTLNSAPTLSPGDLTILRNTANSSWNGDSAGNRQGEFLVVKSVSGAVVVFTSAVLDSYASTVTCGLYKVTPTTSRIKGKLTILGNPSATENLPAIYVHYGRDNLVEGVTFRNTTATCIEFNVCYKPVVRDVDTGKYLTDSGSIQSSGLIFASCQNASARDCILAGDRHGASTGGGGTVVDRFNVFDHCAISSRTNHAADFHGNAEHCEYRNCHIDGSVNLSGGTNKLVGCKIYQHQSSGALVNWEAVRNFGNLIEDCDFYMRGAGPLYVVDASGSGDITANTSGGTLKLDRCRIHDDLTESQSYISIQNNGSTATDMRIEITNCEFIKSATTKYGNVLGVSVTSGGNFASLRYLRNSHVGKVGFGVVSGIDSMEVDGDLGYGNAASSSPTFGITLFKPSRFTLEKQISVASAGTAFTLYVPDTASFIPDMIAGRVDADITATNGNFISVGVNANNRRADFGAFTTAAASSKHSKNSKMLFINSSELANQAVVSGEVLAVMSVDATTDAAAIASNIGGTAGMTLTFRISGRLVNNMPSLP